MKKSLIKVSIIFCMTLLSVIPCQFISDAEEAIRVPQIDGYYWNKQSYLWKLGFAVGWIEACSVATNKIPMAFIFSQQWDKKSEAYILNLKPKLDYIGKYYFIVAENSTKEEGLELYDLIFGQIVDTIENIYSDPRVKNWRISEIMPLVRCRLKEGGTEKDLDEVIAFKTKQNEYLKKSTRGEFKNESDERKYVTSLGEEEPKVLKVLRTKYAVSSDDFKWR